MYIREAHPTDGTRPLRGGVQLADPKTFLEREAVAKNCAGALKLTMPMLIDELDDHAAAAYGAHPDRIYLVGKDGKVVYQGGPGPRGFKPDELEAELRKYLTGSAAAAVRRARI